MTHDSGIDADAVRTTWSAEDGAFVGTCARFPSLSWLSDSEDDADGGIRRLVAEVVSDMAAAGERVRRAERQPQSIRVSKLAS